MKIKLGFESNGEGNNRVSSLSTTEREYMHNVATVGPLYDLEMNDVRKCGYATDTNSSKSAVF